MKVDKQKLIIKSGAKAVLKCLMIFFSSDQFKSKCSQKEATKESVFQSARLPLGFL